jgi:hypothetical protein
MKSDRSPGDDAIPTLTDVVEFDSPALTPEELAALQAEITTRVLELADELLREASGEVEAILFERVSDRLRALLPELIDSVLRERSVRD